MIHHPLAIVGDEDLVIEAVGVVVDERKGLLNYYLAGIDLRLDVMHRHSDLALAVVQLPEDRRAAAVIRRQPLMYVDRAEARNPEDAFFQNVRSPDDSQIGLRRAH
jgi:hypothetical protein